MSYTAHPTEANPHCYSPPLTEIAPPPFDDPHADVVLRSADNVDFLVHRVVLGLVSPFFRDMFTLPPPDSDATTRQVIPLTEDSQAIVLMLKLCYPLMDICLDSLEDIQLLLELTQKYDIEAGFDRARKALVSLPFLDHQPLRVFAIAYHFELEDETKLAAMHFCHHPIIIPYVPELDLIPTFAYHCLLDYRNRCGDAVIALTNSLHWLPANASWVWATCKVCPAGPYRLTLSDGRTWVPRSWFTDYFEQVKDFLRVRPYPKAILDPLFLQASLEKACACWFCGRRASRDLYKYASIVALMVQRVLSEVRAFHSPFITACHCLTFCPSVVGQVELEIPF